MTKKSKTIGSDTWTWEETPETIEALKKLHQLNEIQKLESTASDYGVGK